jgi:DNA-binding PadR family transcriptional regulator
MNDITTKTTFSVGSTTKEGIQVTILEKRVYEITGGGLFDLREISKEEIEVPTSEIWSLVEASKKATTQVGFRGIHNLMVDQFNAK